VRIERKLPVVTVFALLLAACGGDDGSGGSTPTAEATTTAEATETPDAAEATVRVESSDLGDIVVDADGNTLYVFLADEGTESTCYEECEDSWPPLTVDGDPAAGEGIDGSLLGTTERTDGSVQVTLDGHPLYSFAGDEAAGDTNGQGVGDVWFVVSPSGEAIQG
jgi:predicted lipoprotein with Yx(FWY)xxD motif